LNIGQLPTCAFAFIFVFHYFTFPEAKLIFVELYTEKGSLIKISPIELVLSKCVLSSLTHLRNREWNGIGK